MRLWLLLFFYSNLNLRHIQTNCTEYYISSCLSLFFSFPLLSFICVLNVGENKARQQRNIEFDANGTLSHSRLAGMKPCSLTFHIYHWISCSYFPVCVSMPACLPVHVLAHLLSLRFSSFPYICRFVRLFSAHTTSQPIAPGVCVNVLWCCCCSVGGEMDTQRCENAVKAATCMWIKR